MFMSCKEEEAKQVHPRQGQTQNPWARLKEAGDIALMPGPGELRRTILSAQKHHRTMRCHSFLDCGACMGMPACDARPIAVCCALLSMVLLFMLYAARARAGVSALKSVGQREPDFMGCKV